MTERILNNHKLFSKVLFFEGTYNLFNNGAALFILSCINSENKSEMICCFITIDEFSAFISKFLTEFKKLAGDLSKTKVIFTDKDLKEHYTLRACFVDIYRKLCLFHVIQTFTLKIKEIFSSIKNKETRQIKNRRRN